MTRDEWITRFADELQRLRPYLRPSFGHSRLVRTMAVQAYRQGDEAPEAAAQAAHQRMGPPPPRKP
jgi:hypothetical protein